MNSTEIDGNSREAKHDEPFEYGHVSLPNRMEGMIASITANYEMQFRQHPDLAIGSWHEGSFERQYLQALARFTGQLGAAIGVDRSTAHALMDEGYDAP